MKLLSKKKQTVLFMDIATIHTWIDQGDLEDPHELEDAKRALLEIAAISGGRKGLAFVKRLIRKWEARHE